LAIGSSNGGASGAALISGITAGGVKSEAWAPSETWILPSMSMNKTAWQLEQVITPKSCSMELEQRGQLIDIF
jgi:hypothetical protein